MAAELPARYAVDSWQSDDGLPHNTVRAIAQTSDGFLWIGTEKGLARFDGMRFKLIGDAFPPLQNSRTINCLLASRDNALWIGSEGGGLVEWKDGVCRSFFGSTSLPGSKVRCLFQSSDGAILIGTEQGLARLKDGQVTRLKWPPDLGDISVTAITKDQRGFVRLATHKGLFTLDQNDVISSANAGIGPITYALKTVYADRDGNLWFGGSGGLRYVRVEEKAPTVRTTQLLRQVISTVIQDRTGQCWFGTARGVAHMLGDRVLGWPLNQAGAGDSVNAIFEDREGSLWIGGRDGLYRLKPARFNTYTEKEGLTANDVRSLCEDRAGAIWATCWVAGLDRIFEGRMTSVRSTNGLTDDAVLSLLPAKNGGLWVGMDWGRGLNKLNEHLTNVLSPPPGLINAPIRAIHEDRDGALWLGTGKGLNVWRGDKMQTYTSTNGLPGNNVTAIIEDKTHNIWIGTERGLARWDGKTFSQLTEKDGLSDNAVTSLCKDAQGVLWIGTRSHGLNRFRDGKFTAYTTAQGLLSDEITQVLEDNFDCFWITCRRGLLRVKKSDFAAVDRGDQPALRCMVFGRADGLPTVQFSGDAQPAGLKASDGRIWLPTVRGVVVVDTRIDPNPLPPPVVIEEILADDLELRQPTAPSNDDDILSVPPGTRDLEIHYTALSLQSPEQNNFRYRLEGVDDSWVEAGHCRFASYTRLRPGKYRFRVMGCNNDGAWSKTEATIGINLQPYFWQTWWFDVLILCVLSAGLVGIYRLRVGRLREIERLRIRIAADLHDDVGSRLSKVAMLTESETPAGGQQASLTQNISAAVQEIIRAMDEIVWTINPRNDTLDNLANYISHYAQDFFNNTPVRCRLKLPAELPDLPLSTEQRHNVFMVIKEALNNVVKHAQATEVCISLSRQADQFRIVIADNGRGMNLADANTSGEGLANMKDRMRQIGARLQVDSLPGRGTTITMEIRCSSG